MDNASNGVAERAVAQVSETSAWMINHAACLLNLGTVGEDGKGPFERCRGRRLALQ